jgi:hypothetical protein
MRREEAFLVEKKTAQTFVPSFEDASRTIQLVYHICLRIVRVSINSAQKRRLSNDGRRIRKKNQICFSSSTAVLSVVERRTKVNLFTTRILTAKKPRIICLSVAAVV